MSSFLVIEGQTVDITHQANILQALGRQGLGLFLVRVSFPVLDKTGQDTSFLFLLLFWAYLSKYKFASLSNAHTTCGAAHSYALESVSSESRVCLTAVQRGEVPVRIPTSQSVLRTSLGSRK